MFSDKEIYEVTKMLDKFLRRYEKSIKSIAQEFPGTIEEVIEMILIDGLKKIQHDIAMVEDLWMREQEKIAELKDEINMLVPKMEESKETFNLGWNVDFKVLNEAKDYKSMTPEEYDKMLNERIKSRKKE